MDIRLRIAIGKIIWPRNFMKSPYRDCLQVIMEYFPSTCSNTERIVLPMIENVEENEEQEEQRHKTYAKDITCVIEPWLYLSGAIGAQCKDLQRTYGIYEIISIGFRLNKEQKRYHAAKRTKYCFFPLEDNEEAPLEAILQPVIQRLQQNSEENKKTLVHCQLGISRSASCIIAYLMQEQIRSSYPLPIPQNWLFKSKLHCLQQLRPAIHPNRGFQAKLETSPYWLQLAPSS